MPKENDKRENFVRLAEGRTQLALDAIRKIGNLSNSRAYDYTDADVKAIIKAAKSGNIGDGKIFVTPLEKCIRIRTEETGGTAI